MLLYQQEIEKWGPLLACQHCRFSHARTVAKKRAEKKALAEANKNLKELRKIKLAEKKEEGDDYANEYAPHELTEMLN